MNLDERLEALTQTVEIMAGMHGDHEKRLEALTQGLESLAQRQEALTQRQEALTQTVEIVAGMQRDSERRLVAVIDTMNRMGRILEAHDIALDEHDERIERLEKPGQ